MAKLTDDEENVGARRPLIELLLADSARQLTSVAGVSSAMGTRAAILIASASIVTGVQATQIADAGWFVLAVAFAACASLLGVVVVLPRMGREVDLAGVETDGWNETDTVAARRLLYSRLAVLRKDKRSLSWRAIVLVIGFVLLALSLVCVGLYLINVQAPSDWSVK